MRPGGYGAAAAAQQYGASPYHSAGGPQGPRLEGTCMKSLMKQNQEAPLFNRKPANFHAMSLSFLIVLPVLIYFINSACHIFAYKDPVLVYTIMVLSIGLSGLFMALKQTRPGAPMYWANLGLLCFMAIGISIWSCRYNYNRSLEVYYEYEGQMEYTNVVPGEPATAYLDAGKLVFSKGAQIDFAKFASHVVNGITYCVAPIVGGSPGVDTTSFWAAGFDCCTGNFTCDSATDSKARSGLVYLLATEQELFMSATNRSVATPSRDSLFLKWVADVDKAEAAYFNSAVGYLSASSVVYLVCSIFVGIVLHFGQRQAKQPQETL